MGDRAEILLVSRRALLAGGFAALALSGCDRGAPQRVDARGHDAFFLWAGVRPPPFLRRAHTVYLFAGEVRRANGSRFMPLRAVPHVVGPQLWATVRLERLDLGERALQAVIRLPERWAVAGNAVAGLQIDFDAATHGLAGYASFLADLRKRLPHRWKLSVTGLLDWSAGGDPHALAQLAGIIDEFVVQTYQGRNTIPGYEDYLAGLPRLGIPYRVAVAEGGEWREPPALAGDPRYLGTVVFLLNP